MLTNLFHFLTSLTQKKNYAHQPALTQHDIQRLVYFPHYIKASDLTPVWYLEAGAMPPNFTYDGKKLTLNKGKESQEHEAHLG